MKLIRLLAAPVLSFSLLPPAAFAQDVAVPAAPLEQQEQAEAAKQAQAERERKALKLLDEIATEAAGLRLADNRVRAQAAVAELLWPRDEEKARETLQGAQAGLAAASSSVSPDDPRYGQHAQTVNNLRREIVLSVANRDPKLALEMLRSTRPAAPSAPPSGRNFFQPDAELQLETQLAEQVAVRDPKEAVRLAEETLAKGVSGNLPSIVERVRSVDPQAAARLASDIARRLRTTNLSTNYEAAGVAVYLLNFRRPPDNAQPAAGGVPIVSVSGPQPGQFLLDEQARRELLTSLVNAALAPANAQQGRGRGNRPLYGAIQQAMPEIERLMPAQAATLRRTMGGDGAGTDADMLRVVRARRLQDAQAELMRTGTVETLLDAAAKAPAETRQNLYRAAALKAAGDGATERARQIVTQNVTNPQEREQLLRDLDQQMFWRAAERGDVEQARELLSRFRSPEERTGMLLALARGLAGREGKREVAERLLEEVWSQAGGRARNPGQFSAQLQVAQIYAPFNPARAFEIMESCVGQLNELLEAAAVVDGFGHESFDQGELKGGDSGYIWTVLVQQAGEHTGQLALTDFDRAVSTADRFQRPEARLRARLSVARAVLARGNSYAPGGRRYGVERRGVRFGRN